MPASSSSSSSSKRSPALAAGRRRLGLFTFLALLSLSCTLWSFAQERDAARAVSHKYYYVTDDVTDGGDDGVVTTRHQRRNGGTTTLGNSEGENSDGDFSYERRLLDLHDFSYVLDNYDACNPRHVDHGSGLSLLILVHSAPQHKGQRALIRETWGSTAALGETAVLLFLLGTVNDTELQNSIEDENSSHGDILQGNFIDSYYNLTYKHTMGLKYATERCYRVPHVLKTDDDVFVNTPALLAILEPDQTSVESTAAQLLSTETVTESKLEKRFKSPSKKPSSKSVMMLSVSDSKSDSKEVISVASDNAKVDSKLKWRNKDIDRFIYCVINEKAWVRRSYRSKWRVSPRQYPANTYPTYCSGGFVLYSNDIVRRLYRELRNREDIFFWIDDVLVTGTLAEQIGVGHLDAKKEQLTEDETKEMVREYKKSKNRFRLLSKGRDEAKWRNKEFLFGPWDVTAEDAKILWDVVSEDWD